MSEIANEILGKHRLVKLLVTTDTLIIFKKIWNLKNSADELKQGKKGNL